MLGDEHQRGKLSVAHEATRVCDDPTRETPELFVTMACAVIVVAMCWTAASRLIPAALGVAVQLLARERGVRIG